MTVLREPSLLLAFVAGRKRRRPDAVLEAGVRDVIAAHAAIGDTEALPAPVPGRGGAASPTRPAPTPHEGTQR